MSHWAKLQQQNGILEGLAQAQPDDLVIVSDVDEIPRAIVIRQLRMCGGYNFPVELQMASYMYDFACPQRALLFGKSQRKAKVDSQNSLISLFSGNAPCHILIFAPSSVRHPSRVLLSTHCRPKSPPAISVPHVGRLCCDDS